MLNHLMYLAKLASHGMPQDIRLLYKEAESVPWFTMSSSPNTKLQRSYHQAHTEVTVTAT